MSEVLAVSNQTRGNTVAGRVVVADTFRSRLLGLLARPPLQPGEGLLIRPCKSVHTWGMKYPIDVAFIDRDWRVVQAVHALVPWRGTSFFRRAEMALELPAGTLAATGLTAGDQLQPIAPAEPIAPAADATAPPGAQFPR